MINNAMYFNYSNNMNDFRSPGGYCMQGAYIPYYQQNQCSYMGGNNLPGLGFQQQHINCPYFRQNIQYSPAVQCYNAAGMPSIMDDEEYIGHINPSQLNMRTVSINEIID